MRRFALCVLFLFPTSCSLMFVNGPPEDAKYVEPGECTVSNGWPAFDVILALLETLRTGYAITRTDEDYRGMTLSRPSDIGIGVALTALAAISAEVGFNRVKACKDAMIDDRDSRLRPPRRRRTAAPASYAPSAAPSTDTTTSASRAAGTPPAEQQQSDSE
ncbi:MAG TPA: hypothetical protein VHO67_03630 [Polyangia bacterium]|nr:hypothetical protein [Polyangia bacterium]